MHNNFLKNIWLSSILFGITSVLISLSIFLIFDAMSYIPSTIESKFTPLDLLLSLIIAPIYETLLILALLYVLELFFSTLMSSVIILLFFSFLHYFNHWTASLITLPMFILSLIYFINWRDETLTKTIGGVIGIHFTYNFVISTIDLIQNRGFTY